MSTASWKAIYEVIHSALIDELIDRFPETKPELGMPFRRDQWDAPLQKDGSLLLCKVHSNTPGDLCCLVFLGLDGSDFSKPELSDLWNSLWARAERIFSQRVIQAGFSECMGISVQDNFSAQYPAIRRFIWVPLRTEKGCFYLGIGIKVS